MKRTLGMLLVAALTFSHSLSAQVTPQAEPRTPLTWSLSGGDVQLVAVNSNVAVEQLRGKAALSHLQNLLSKKSGAFAAARQSLQERGFEPTETVYVERTIRRARNLDPWSNPAFRFAQDHSESNSDGEIVFWSWNDGNNATWEGAIYVEIYSADAASTWEGQIDDSTSNHPWVYYEKTWQGGGGGGPIETKAPPLPGYYAQAVPALSTPGSRGNVMLAGSFYTWAVCWRTAVVTGCTAAALGCRMTGPGWPACFGGWCVGAEVGGAVGCYLQN